jgi:hypothetical protein
MEHLDTARIPQGAGRVPGAPTTMFHPPTEVDFGM